MKKALLSVTLLVLFVTEIVAQVTISPTAVFISRDRFGSFVVINNSNMPQEVTVDFILTYPASDSLGNVRIREADPQTPGFKVITDWIRSFPRTFVLQPNQRQTVRLTVRPTGPLSDGTYWTRLRVTSNPQTAEIGAENTTEVATQITIKFEQIISVFFKNGAVASAVAIDGVRAINQNNSRLFVFDYRLTGNSPFIGTIDFELKDASGRSLHQNRVITSIYDNGSRNFAVPIDELPSGVYQATVTFTGRRPDIPAQDNVPMETATRTFQVRVD